MDLCRKSEKREWGELAKYFYKYAIIATNTHLAPDKARGGNISTWRNRENGAYRQLDYMIISNKQRNWATQTRAKGIGNINGSHRRQLVLMKYAFAPNTRTTKQREKEIYITILIH